MTNRRLEQFEKKINSTRLIIQKRDDLVIKFVYEETIELNNQISEQGYDDFYEFADRKYDLEENYPEVGWWKEIRNELVNYFVGGNQKGFEECYFYSAVE